VAPVATAAAGIVRTFGKGNFFIVGAIIKTQVTTFHIPKMDCPSEEQMIRMKLTGFDSIRSMKFDIPGRKLEIIHSGETDKIDEAIASLRLDSSIVESIEHESTAGEDTSNVENHQRKLLIAVLAINFFFFLLEMATGLISRSMGLIADSLDMLADAVVYGLALWAVGSHLSRKKNVARLSGYFQLILAVFGFVEVVRRFILPTETPDFIQMIGISFFALIGNTASLVILNRSRDSGAHMEASRIFTSNDVIANIGVIAAGVIVYFSNSRYPDLVIGAVVFYLVLQGAFRIIRLAK